MATYPADLRYSKDHEWVRAEGDRWRVGITQFAANQLGDVVMAELPKVGAVVEQGAPVGTIESVKAVSELYAPVSGKVTAVNEELISDPERINTDPYGSGWMIEIEPSDRAELDDLLAGEAYTAFVAESE